MPKLWTFTSSFDSVKTVLELMDAVPAKIDLLNAEDVHASYFRIQREYEDHPFDEIRPLTFRSMPTHQLLIDDPRFRFDLVEFGMFPYVSERLRTVLALEGSVAAYRAVDTRRCPAEVQAMNYMVMDVIPLADPVDRTKTPGFTWTQHSRDGSTRQEWSLMSQDAMDFGGDTWWREDFTPPAPLFRMTGASWTLATDELAARIMDAGMSDVRFNDYSGQQKPGGLYVRRGGHGPDQSERVWTRIDPD